MPPEHPKKTIEISGSLYQRMEDSKPEYLSTTAFFQLMADQGLRRVDKGITLAEVAAPAGGLAQEASGASTSNKEVINKRNKERARDLCKTRSQYTEDFERFWSIYQSSPSKANGQSKVKAYEEWTKAVKVEDPQRLTQAAKKAIEEVELLIACGDFCAPLPDCFRWLRDQKYSVLLENHMPTQSSSAVTLY